MSATAAPICVVDLDMEQLEAILGRAKDLGLPEEDVAILRKVIESNATLLELLQQKNLSMKRLRQLLFGKKTETRENVTGKGKEKPFEGKKGDPKKKRKGHGRNSAKDYVGAEWTSRSRRRRSSPTPGSVRRSSTAGSAGTS